MMDRNRLIELLAAGESLEIEFKSDRRQISDNEIYEEIVAFANTKGGVLLIGVEDNGAITGARHRHGKTTDPVKLQSAIFNNTVPNINTRVSVIPHENADHVPHFLLDTGGAGMVVYRHAGLRSRFFGRNHLENRGDGGI